MFILKQEHIKNSYNICNMPFVKKKKKCFLFLAVYFCPKVQSAVTMKTGETQKALKAVSARVLLYKKNTVHMKCTRLYRAIQDVTAKPVRKHTVIVHRNSSHDSNRHCIDICTLSHLLSIIMHKYKAFTLKAYTDRRLTDQHPNHGKMFTMQCASSGRVCTTLCI